MCLGNLVHYPLFSWHRRFACCQHTRSCALLWYSMHSCVCDASRCVWSRLREAATCLWNSVCVSHFYTAAGTTFEARLIALSFSKSKPHVHCRYTLAVWQSSRTASECCQTHSKLPTVRSNEIQPHPSGRGQHKIVIDSCLTVPHSNSVARPRPPLSGNQSPKHSAFRKLSALPPALGGSGNGSAAYRSCSQ